MDFNSIFKIESLLTSFIYFIILIKIFFLFFSIGHILLSHSTSSLKEKDSTFLYWKNRMEFIFTICMAILLIFIFNPRFKNKIYITKEMQILFFIFGFILIFTADWNLFIKEAPWYKKIISSFN